MPEKATTKRDIDEEDAEALEEHYGSVREGVSSLVNSHLREEEWVREIKENETHAVDAIGKNVDDMSQIVNKNNLTLDEIAQNIIETTGSLKRTTLRNLADRTGYSRNSFRTVYSRLKNNYDYFQIDKKTVTEATREKREEIQIQALKLYQEQIVSDKQEAKDYLQDLIKEATEKAKKH